MKKIFAASGMVFLLMGSIAACTNLNPTQSGALSGGAIGAAGGAGISALSGGNAGVGALVGGGLGALAGGIIGNERGR